MSFPGLLLLFFFFFKTTFRRKYRDHKLGVIPPPPSFPRDHLCFRALEVEVGGKLLFPVPSILAVGITKLYV